MENLDDLYKWFDENRGSIIADHLNECVLLKDKSVIGYYPNTDAALSDAEKNGFILGEFLIQDCITDEDEIMLYYNYNQAVCFGVTLGYREPLNNLLKFVPDTVALPVISLSAIVKALSSLMPSLFFNTLVLG